MRAANRQRLEHFHPAAFAALAKFVESPFAATPSGVHFLGQDWARQTLPGVPEQALLVVFGLPWPEQLEALLNTQPQRLLLVESQPELAWAMLEAFDYSAWLERPELELCVATPEQLLISFPAALQRLRRLDQVRWLESQPAAELAERVQRIFLTPVWRAARDQHTAAVTPAELSAALTTLYAELEPASQAVYARYALSCRSGCSGCCRDGVSSLLALFPGEWLLVWEQLARWSENARTHLARQLLQWARHNSTLVVQLLTLFDTQMAQTHTPEFSQEHLQLNQSQRQTPCFLLDPDSGACRVYAGRPLTCRLFGVSQYYGRQPYTCQLDWERQAEILRQPQPQLVNAGQWRQRMQAAHQSRPYKWPLVLWLLRQLQPEAPGWRHTACLEESTFADWLEPGGFERWLACFEG